VLDASIIRVVKVIRALMTEEVSTSEMSVNFYQTTWRNIQKTVIFISCAVREVQCGNILCSTFLDTSQQVCGDTNSFPSFLTSDHPCHWFLHCTLLVVHSPVSKSLVEWSPDIKAAKVLNILFQHMGLENSRCSMNSTWVVKLNSYVKFWNCTLAFDLE
jgi:hypothetical protein